MGKENVVAENEIIIRENPVSRYLFNNTRSAWIWLIIRLYVGYVWLTSGWGKLGSPAWTGENAGAAIQGFVGGAIEKSATGGDVAGWYASFLENIVLPNATVFSYLVVFGEIAVGLGLILGLLTGIAAFFGSIMNVTFLFAGTLSSNPLLFILASWLVLAWKVAGWYGLDRWALPRLGTPWTRKNN
ncbi:DoxX family membrane protein [Ornithinibacillus halophilus]|uniref:Thiosulfate dehydrogenase [quinone] large subunit n=1 Tax=Ornithinibacillus halophilus TaxID=930117 RepID=A0A1M5FWK0_9BACI|nr:DoxX family membrane protein [Ornithinibacillus halophilus]SHF95846.1 thiosulfate dehydrogenase [quinone] large subunit [Ornithinibacillus halophilus]